MNNYEFSSNQQNQPRPPYFPNHYPNQPHPSYTFQQGGQNPSMQPSHSQFYIPGPIQFQQINQAPQNYQVRPQGHDNPQQMYQFPQYQFPGQPQFNFQPPNQELDKEVQRDLNELNEIHEEHFGNGNGKQNKHKGNGKDPKSASQQKNQMNMAKSKLKKGSGKAPENSENGAGQQKLGSQSLTSPANASNQNLTDDDDYRSLDTQERKMLSKLLEKFRGDWRKIALHMVHKCCVQQMEVQDVLSKMKESGQGDDNIKNLQFSKQEDILLIELLNKHEKCWKRVQPHFEGRSVTMLKNRFYYLCKKGIIDRSSVTWVYGKGKYEQSSGEGNESVIVSGNSGVNSKRKLDTDSSDGKNESDNNQLSGSEPSKKIKGNEE